MRRRDLMIGFGVAALAACSPPAQQKAPAPQAAPATAPPTGDPALVIRPIYDRYLTQGADSDSPELHDQAPWSADLWAKLDGMMHRTQAGDEPNLDFDPIIGAQDYRITDLNVATDGAVQGDHAVVRASFKNLGDQTDILYDMVWDGHGWRVDNIRGHDWDLRQIASQ